MDIDLRHSILIKHLWTSLLVHADDASKPLPSQHVVKSLVDFRERETMGYKLLNLQFLQKCTGNKG